VDIFGYIMNATIKNLGITGRISSVISIAITSHSASGGICRYAYGSTISNCHNMGF
jgi:hypothetical protein